MEDLHDDRNDIFLANPRVRRRTIRKFPGVDLDLIPEEEWLTILDEAFHDVAPQGH